MNDFLLGAEILAYSGAGLLSARWFYGKERAAIIDHYAANTRTSWGGVIKDPVKEFNDEDQIHSMFFNAFAGVIWPVSWLFYLCVVGGSRFLGSTSTLSRYEIDRGEEEKRNKIGALERELFSQDNDRPDHIA